MAVSYWCMPCNEDAQSFAAAIEALARAQGAPVFLPHLTLATLEHRAPDISSVLRTLEGLELLPSGIDRTAAFTTSLFVRFAPSAGLLAARRLMEQMPGLQSGRTFDPHISLCYGAPPAHAIPEVDELAQHTRAVRFDKLVAINVSLPVASYADVAAWTVAETFALHTDCAPPS